MRGCIRGTAQLLLRIKRPRGVICVLRSNVPAAATHPQIRKGAERSPSAAPVYLLNADLFNLLDFGSENFRSDGTENPFLCPEWRLSGAFRRSMPYFLVCGIGGALADRSRRLRNMCIS